MADDAGALELGVLAILLKDVLGLLLISLLLSLAVSFEDEEDFVRFAWGINGTVFWGPALSSLSSPLLE